MADINVRIVGTANVQQMAGAFGKLQGQVTALNTQLAQMVALQNGVDPTGYHNMAKAAAQNDKIFRNAVASTGMFEQMQLRVNRATDDYVEALQKQKLSFREMKKQRKVAAAAYKEQIAMEQMMVKQGLQTNARGKQVFDVTYPRQVSAELDTASKRMGWFNHQLKSGAHQMVNWGKNTQWAGRQLMVGFTIPIAAAGAAAGVLAYQLDKEFTRIAKVYDTTADATSTSMKDMMAVEKELQELREAGTQTAIKAAKEYGSAAQDTLQVQAELAATGLSGIELQKATAEVMRIARLGEVETKVAIDSTIALQSVFSDTIKTSKDLADAFNYMNSIENATSLTTEDFAAAIPIAAAPVKQFGGDIKELGILLTAMRERGIAATQGANAIKAAMQRLGRPSKQVRAEWEALTGTDITKIFEESDSLIDIFTRIREATRDLSNKDQMKAFAGLFGTYQVTRMGALVEGMDALATGTGQVSDAMRISQQSTESWGKTAEMEMKRYRESISGQWDTALQEMKIQLSTLGEPFIQIATVVVKGISWIIDKFNELPQVAKILAGLAIGAAALAGPIVMLVGLTANLAGNMLKGIGMLSGWIAKMDIGTASSRASALATSLATAGFMDETKAVTELTAAINAMTTAQKRANDMTMAASRQSQSRATAAATAASTAQAAQPGLVAPLVLPAHVTRGAIDLSDPVARQQALTVQKDLTESTVEGSKAMGETERKATGAAAAMSVASLAMAGTLVSSNKWVDLLAQATLIATIAVPAAKAILSAAKGAIAYSVKRLAVEKATAGVAAKGLAGAKTSLAAMFTKTNVVVGLIAAAGFGLWKLHQRSEEAAERQLELQKRINAAADDYADSMGVRRRPEPVGLETVGIPDAQYNQYQRDVKYFREDEEGKQNAKDFGDMDADEQRNYAAERYIELLSETEMTAAQVETSIAALYKVGAGRSAQDAYYIAGEIRKDYGELMNMDWSSAFAQIKKNFDDAVSVNVGAKAYSDPEQVEKMAKEDAGKLADIVKQALTAADGPEEVKQVFDQLAGAALDGWSDVDNAFRGDKRFGKEWGEFLKEQGIEGTQELSQWFRANDGQVTHLLTERFGDHANVIQDQLTNANTLEKAIISAYADADDLGDVMGDVGNKTSTVWELYDNFNVKAATMSFREIREEAAATTNEMLNTINLLGMDFPTGANWNVEDMTLSQLDRMFDAMDPEKVAQLAQQYEAFAKANNIKINTNPAITLHNILNNIKNEAEGAESAIKGMASAFTMNKSEALSIYKDAIQSVQKDIADDISDGFDANMDAAIDARQEMWDKRSDALDASIDRRKEALEARHEREQNGLDAKWERKNDAAEKYWDNRLDGINNAIEAEERAEEKRQKMFDAEIARINRLNDAMNRNIDFNVALNEGNFDEAARIRNDVTASATTTALERAAEVSGERSSRRTRRMEGRLESVEEAKDKYMKRLENREEAERRHLDKVQKMREKALDRQTDAQKKALSKQTENDMNATRKKWEYEKESLQDRLDLFLAYIPRNEKELRKHIKDVGLNYDKFGSDLKGKGDDWSGELGKSLRKYIRQSGNKLKSDKMWKRLGKASRREILEGMGFDGGMSEFRHFIKTGEMGGGKKRTGKYKPSSPGHVPPDIYNHSGGVVGEAPSSRAGVARTTRGLHPSERRITAQKGEYIINRKASEKHRGILDKINQGTLTGHDGDGSGNAYGVGGPGGPGIAGLVAGFAAKGFAAGVAKSMQAAVQKKRQESLFTGLFTSGTAGMYGDRSFNATQLKNAATIATVGSNMGMSARDLMIGIMTAITESGLINVNYGDRDSLGLFQQRPSMGWGTPAQVTDPEYAARKFFAGLKGITDRASMTPWAAAQAVQRSAYADGSNYRQYWDEAQAIFGRGLIRNKFGYGIGVGFMQGSGGRHRPVAGRITNGLHYNNAIDIGAGRGTPVYAAADGKVTRSEDIRGPLPTDKYDGDGPYGSYGRVIKISHGAFDTLYAHLSQRFVRDGQTVKGGAKIGLSGNTGNSSGPHLHFESHGASPYAFLKQGGTVKRDNTPAVLHKDERVLTAPLTKKLDYAVDALYRASKSKGTGGPYGKFNYPTAGTGLADSPYNWITNTKVANSAAGPSGPIKVRAGTYNVLYSTKNKATKTDLTGLMSKSDILALTEYSGAKRKINPWLRDKGWGIYGPRGPKRDSVIAYNKSKYALSRGGEYKLNNTAEGARWLGARNEDYYPHYASYGMMTDKKSGGKFWFVSAHTIAHARRSQKAAAVRLEQYARLRKLHNRLQRSAPVLMGGDFNLSGKMSPFMEKRIGMKSDRPGDLDHILYSGRTKQLGLQVKEHGLSSDHPAVLAQFNIPGLAKGAENIRWDNTIANLHKGESVLTADISDKFKRGVDNFANGGETVYNVNMVMNEVVDGKKLFKEFKAEMKREESRKPQSRRG